MKRPPALLLVEGPDDEHVLYALAVAHALPQTFAVKPLGGVDKLFDDLRVRLKARNERRLAIVLDADENLTTRWQAIWQRVEEAFPGRFPVEPVAEGTVVALDADLTFGVWVMPDNLLPGTLETFLAFLVPPGDALLPQVDALLGSLGADQRFPDVRRPKARLHAWLALQNEPGKPLGQAITARYLDASCAGAQTFVAWLRAMFP
jgi:hypothetical protein